MTTEIRGRGHQHTFFSCYPKRQKKKKVKALKPQFIMLKYILFYSFLFCSIHVNSGPEISLMLFLFSSISWKHPCIFPSAVLEKIEWCPWNSRNVLEFNFFKFEYALSANPTKWSNTLKQFVGNSIFDHFVGMGLKGLKYSKLKRELLFYTQ